VTTTVPAYPRIYLASRSPRRRELLKQLGVSFEMLLLREHSARIVDVNEDVKAGESPDRYVERVCRTKAEIGWLRVLQRTLPRLPVLAADTTVCIGDCVFGKPATREAAAGMLRALSGQEHRVLTAVAVAWESGVELIVNENRVRFRELTDAEIQQYIATGEPMDKAGGYAIQGRAAAFIPEILGSFTGVMGLPLYETAMLLAKYR
jgi:septum formation protein